GEGGGGGGIKGRAERVGGIVEREACACRKDGAGQGAAQVLLLTVRYREPQCQGRPEKARYVAGTPGGGASARGEVTWTASRGAGAQLQERVDQRGQGRQLDRGQNRAEGAGPRSAA